MAPEPSAPTPAPTPASASAPTPAPASAPPPAAPPGDRALAAVRSALESAGVTADPSELAALVPAHERMRARVAVLEAALDAGEAAASSEPAGTFVPGASA
jgi:hypothetical protein